MGIKNINLVFTHTPMCASTVYLVLSRVLWKNIIGMLLGGIRTHDPCNSRAVSYQLDYRGCPVARGSMVLHYSREINIANLPWRKIKFTKKFVIRTGFHLLWHKERWIPVKFSWGSEDQRWLSSLWITNHTRMDWSWNKTNNINKHFLFYFILFQAHPTAQVPITEWIKTLKLHNIAQ